MEESVIISNGNLTAIFNVIGAELVSLRDAMGKEIIWQNEQGLWAGHAPILFPICGGLKEDKYEFDKKEYTLQKHGFVRREPFKVEKVELESAVFSYTFNQETLKKYPFKFKFIVKYTLKDNDLVVDYTVENLDDKDMYYSVGGHEAYALEGEFTDYSVKFEHKEDLNAYNIEGNLLSHEYTNVGKNTDNIDLDYKYFTIDALSFIDLKSRKATLYNNKTGKELVEVNYNGFNTLFIWTKPGAKYVCLETWAGMPDRVGSNYKLEEKDGIVKLEKGKTKTLTHTITVK